MKTKKRARSTTRWGVSPGRALQFSIASIAMLCGFTASAQAVTWTVCPAGCDFVLIQAAIDDAGTMDGDILEISADLYNTEAITISKDLTLIGGGVGATIIQFGGDSVITIDDFVDSTLSDLTVSGGFSGNRGGGVRVGSSAEVIIRNAEVVGNTAISAGGGIYSTGDLTLDNVEVSGNVVNSGAGGGIYISTGEVTIVNSKINGNGAHSGGGIENRGILTIDRSEITNNSAVVLQAGAVFGGGISNLDFGVLTITRSTISGNHSDGDAGGLYIENNATLENTTVSGNVAQNGEGGGILYTDNVHIFNPTELFLRNVTITDNSATTVAGVFNQPNFGGNGTVRSKNSIIADQASGTDCGGAGNHFSDGYNIESGTSCGFAGASNLQNTDPLLARLVDAGGPTKTHPLLWGSPAIDGADPINGCLDTDQRGQVYLDVPLIGNEPADEVCDIGAFEYNQLAQAGFEGSGGGWWRAYRLRAGDGRVCPDALDPNQSHSGRCHFRLVANGNQKGIYQRVKRSGGSAGDSYTLTVWSATGAAAAGGAIGARVVLRDQKGNGNQFAACPINIAQHGWEKCEVTITAAQDYKKVTVLVLSSLGAGAVAIDDVGLVPHGP